MLKHPLHWANRLFPNARFSVWFKTLIKMQLMVDLLMLVHSLLVGKDVDMAISNLHTMEEAIVMARWRKWGAWLPSGRRWRRTAAISCSPLAKLPYPSGMH